MDKKSTEVPLEPGKEVNATFPRKSTASHRKRRGTGLTNQYKNCYLYGYVIIISLGGLITGMIILNIRLQSYCIQYPLSVYSKII